VVFCPIGLSNTDANQVIGSCQVDQGREAAVRFQVCCSACGAVTMSAEAHLDLLTEGIGDLIGLYGGGVLRTRRDDGRSGIWEWV